MIMGSNPDYPTYVFNYLAPNSLGKKGIVLFKFNAIFDNSQAFWARQTISSTGKEEPMGLVKGESDNTLYSLCYIPDGE